MPWSRSRFAIVKPEHPAPMMHVVIVRVCPAPDLRHQSCDELPLAPLVGHDSSHCGAHCVEGRPEVRLERLGRQSPIARTDRLDEAPVLVGRISPSDRSHPDRLESLGVVEELFDLADHPTIRAVRHESEVEVPMGVQPIGHVGVPTSHAGVRLVDGRDECLPTGHDRPVECDRIEQESQFVDLDGGSDIEWGDSRPSLRFDHDEPLTGESHQRFTQRRR